MGIKFANYKIEGVQNGAVVHLFFDVGDLHEAETLITSGRSLGARGTVTQETTAPKPAKAKPVAAPPKPVDDDDDEEEEEEEEPAAKTDDDDDEEEAPAAPAPTTAKVKITKEMQTLKFRGVVKALVDQGFTTKASLTKICKKIRDKVPALEAVAEDQIATRVDTAADMLGIED